MAAAKGKVKKAGTRKRREKKNIERGAAHIRSSFNNTMVTITDCRATPYPGRPPADLASGAARRALLSPRRPPARPRLRPPWNMASALWKSM